MDIRGRRLVVIGGAGLIGSHAVDLSLMVGSPARRIGWMSRDGERLGSDLPWLKIAFIATRGLARLAARARAGILR